MGVNTFPREITMGSGEAADVFDIRPGELLLAFLPGFSDGQIQAVLDGGGFAERTEDLPTVERVRSQGMRWVDVRAGDVDRTVARSILVGVPECWAASPVYVSRRSPFPSKASSPLPGSIAVELVTAGDAATIDQITSLGLRLDAEWSEVMAPLLRFHPAEGHLVDDGFELVARVDALSGVADAELDWMRLDPMALVPASTLYPKQWNLKQIGMPTAWNKSRGKPAVIVAVIDLGFDLAHPGIAASLTPPSLRTWVSNGYGGLPSFSPNAQVDMTPTQPPTETSNDFRWHGTAVAGIIAGSHVATSGAAGVAPGCRLMPVRTWPASVLNVAAGLTWAVNHGARVVNFSITLAGDHSKMVPAVTHAWNQNVVMCAATGFGVVGMPANSAVDYPAATAEVIGVGAATKTGMPKLLAGPEWWFSLAGPEVSLLAPGIQIVSTDARGAAGYNQGGPNRHTLWFGRNYAGAAAGPPGGDHTLCFTSTSSAAPQVSAVAALIRSRHPNFTVLQVRAALEKACDKVGPPGTYPVPTANGQRSMVMGYGRLNAAKAVT